MNRTEEQIELFIDKQENYSKAVVKQFTAGGLRQPVESVSRSTYTLSQSPSLSIFANFHKTSPLQITNFVSLKPNLISCDHLCNAFQGFILCSLRLPTWFSLRPQIFIESTNPVPESRVSSIAFSIVASSSSSQQQKLNYDTLGLICIYQNGYNLYRGFKSPQDIAKALKDSFFR